MTAILCSRPADIVEQHFSRACALLAEARWSQATKDTPAARLQVELCLARVDAILDDWHETRVALG